MCVRPQLRLVLRNYLDHPKALAAQEDILREFTQTPRVGPPPRPRRSIYLPFIRQTLESYPTLTASRLYVMAYGRGYPGNPDHLRHLIASHRCRTRTFAAY
jgi:hypothetical protein